MTKSSAVRIWQRPTQDFLKGTLSTLWLDEHKTKSVLVGQLHDGTITAQTVVFEKLTRKQAFQWLKRNPDALTNAEGTYMKKVVSLAEDVHVFVKPEKVEYKPDEVAILHGVKLLGLASKNGRTYTPEAVRGAVSRYEGIQANIDHPPDGDETRRFRDRIGTYKQVRYVEDEGLFGDLHCNPAHPDVPTLMGWAQHDPTAVGLSHNATGRGRVINKKFVVEEITNVRHVDIVADPGSTKGLFESTDDEEDSEETETKGRDEVEFSELTLADIKSKRPDLVAAHAKQVTEEISEGEDQKKLVAERDSLKKDIDELKVKDVVREHNAMVEKKLVESKIPKHAITDTFRGMLQAAKDEATVDILIEDRKKIAGVSDPKSREQNIEESGGKGKATTGKEFAKAISK